MSRVTDIRYVGYAVPDLDLERAFYRDKWGLREVREQDGMVYFAAEGHDELFVVRLRRDELQRVDIIAFAADSRADVDALFSKVSGSGCQIIFEPRPLDGFGGGYGFRFFSPDGLPFEVSSDVARGEARPMQRWDGIPEKISHIVLHSPKHKEMTQWFIDVLGLRLSDWLGDFMSFLRSNEWHHRIALLPGPPCLNHVAYDVDIRWGPGRHTAGNNTFSYFTTPHGFAVEYTSELERVDEATWEPKVHTPTPTTMDQWQIGVGGPQTMPHPEADPGLFKTPAA
jgi:catechol 2,3-dioxygenase-like lactoylglutathione lyase family enzyme